VRVETIFYITEKDDLLFRRFSDRNDRENTYFETFIAKGHSIGCPCPPYREFKIVIIAITPITKSYNIKKQT